MPAPDVIAFVRAALPPPPARVLEIGAGDGSLAEALTAAGYDVVAIDPAGESETVRQVRLHELDEPDGSFDAAVAIVSLHHVEPLGESCARLARLIRDRGTLIIDEFDVERYDERAARWWLEHQDEETHAHELIEGLRDHLHPVGRIRGALMPWFEIGEAVPGPYLYRWNMPEGVRETEERLIAEGAIPATGARLVSRRGASGGG